MPHIETLPDSAEALMISATTDANRPMELVVPLTDRLAVLEAAARPSVQSAIMKLGPTPANVKQCRRKISTSMASRMSISHLPFSIRRRLRSRLWMARPVHSIIALQL